VLEEYHQTPPPTLVHGGAPGADSEAAYVAAYLLEWPVEAHPADWQRHGRAAGPIRNQQMVDSGADLVIAFPGGRGTADLIRRAPGIPVPVMPPASPQKRVRSTPARQPQPTQPRPWVAP